MQYVGFIYDLILYITGGYCSGKPDGYYAHADCDKFYRCSGFTTYLMTCAPGTIFDPTINVCAIPEMVDRPECKE